MQSKTTLVVVLAFCLAACGDGGPDHAAVENAYNAALGTNYMTHVTSEHESCLKQPDSTYMCEADLKDLTGKYVARRTRVALRKTPSGWVPT